MVYVRGKSGDYMIEEPQDPRILHLFGDTPLEESSGDIGGLLTEGNIDWDVFEQLSQLSKKNPYLECIIDNLLVKAGELPKKEREQYVREADEFCSIPAGHDNKYFFRNFFVYLFENTRGIEDKEKRNFVCTAKMVYDSVYQTLFEKTGSNEDTMESLGGMIRPETNFEDQRFNRGDYDKLKKELSIRKLVDEDSEELYEKKTVADIIEHITAEK